MNTETLTTPRDGQLTKSVDKYTAQIPSMAYLGLAVGSIVLSASIAAFSRRKSMASFVGLWAPTLLLLGIYNKLVKLGESDQQQSQLH